MPVLFPLSQIVRSLLSQVIVLANPCLADVLLISGEKALLGQLVQQRIQRSRLHVKHMIRAFAQFFNDLVYYDESVRIEVEKSNMLTEYWKPELTEIILLMEHNSCLLWIDRYVVLFDALSEGRKTV